MALRRNKGSILAVLALAAAALGGALALSYGGSGPPGPVLAAGDAQLPRLKGEIGDFSYFDAPKPVPPLAFEDGAGRSLALADLKGRVVLVNFWATWCAPCVREMPSLDRLEATLGGKDFIVLDLSLDRRGKAAIEPYFAANKLSHLGVYLDPDGKGFHAWHGAGVPTSFLIDRDGHARGLMVGAADWDSPAAIALIRHFLAEGRAQRLEETRATTSRPQG